MVQAFNAVPMTIDTERFRSNDPYVVLGVPHGADETAVKKAYRKLVKEHHPDQNRDDLQAEARLKAVIAAYEFITHKPRVSSTSWSDGHTTGYNNPFDDIIRTMAESFGAMHRQIFDTIAAANPMAAQHHLRNIEQRLRELEELSTLCTDEARHSRTQAALHFKTHYTGLRHIFKKHSSKTDRLAANIAMIYIAQSHDGFERATKARIAQIMKTMQTQADPQSGMLTDMFASASLARRINEITVGIRERRECFDTAAAVLAGEKKPLRPLP